MDLRHQTYTSDLIPLTYNLSQFTILNSLFCQNDVTKIYSILFLISTHPVRGSHRVVAMSTQEVDYCLTLTISLPHTTPPSGGARNKRLSLEHNL